MVTLDQLVQNYKPHELDFVFPNSSGDTRLYLDLYLFYHSPEPRWHSIQSLIFTYFNHYLDKYRSGEINADQLERHLMFPEVPYIALGFCKTGIHGQGGAEDRARVIRQSIFDNEEIQEVGLTEIAEMSIQVPNMGPDGMSDLVGNFAIHHLIQYTHEQCKEFDLSTATYSVGRALNPETMLWEPVPKVDLPFFETGEPRILVPRHITKRIPVFSTTGFFENYLRYVLKGEKEDQLNAIQTIGKRPRVTFKQVKEELKSMHGTVGRGTRKEAESRSELIESYVDKTTIYRDPLKPTRKKEDIDWGSYIDELAQIPTGQRSARAYAEYLKKLFTALYDGRLANGKTEKRSVDNIFRYDVSFSNGAETPLFRVINNQRLRAGVLLVEAKNYDKTELANDAFNQARGYTIQDGRELIFLVTRPDIDEMHIQRAQRHFLAQKAVILPLGDSDLRQLIEKRKNDHLDFDEFLTERLLAILSA
ncbi:MAG: hypothetical protein WEC84_01785 [Candidatus Andersenbacteria bacterium]